MKDRDLFMETLREVKEIVRTSEKPLSKDEIMAYFKDVKLNAEQEMMIIEYLHTDEEPVNEVIEESAEEVKEETVEDSKSLSMYMEDINGLKKYSDAELGMMYVKLLQGDESVIAKICEGFIKRVVDIAGEYRKYGIEDVIQEGNMGLFTELTRLCGSKAAVDVEASLDMAVREAISSYIAEIAGEKDSEQTVLGKVNLINEAIKLLTTEKGREPSLSELAEYTGLLEDELNDIMAIIKKADR